jgi:large subunit ribosomal protein L3
MITQVFATKQKMTQAWTKLGKRMAVTQLAVINNVVVDQKLDAEQQPLSFEIGYGQKKLKNVNKPLRSRLEKSGFSVGIKNIKQVAAEKGSTLKTGDTVKVQDVLTVGDVVKVQGVTKGRGFAGAIKRHGFSGGPKTHGQSDRWRAVGAIGQRTTPGRVFRGKKMPGHYGTDVQTVLGLTVIHIDSETQTVWLSGPVPGHMKGMVQITKTGLKKNIDLDQKASGIPAAPVVEVEEKAPEAASEAPATEVVEEGTAQ